MEICNIAQCTGCGLCVNLCHKNAIKMTIGKNDFLYPQIDEALCVQCNACQKACPANNQWDRQSNVRAVYAAWNKSKTVRDRSASGGVFSLLAETVIQKGGAVVGVRWTKDWSAEHCIVNTADELAQLNGSKYVQSKTNDIYRQVRQLLSSGRLVLFSGTPCQNHALKMYLQRDYENLLQIDLVCHGVPSEAILHRHMGEINPQGKNVTHIALRHKDPYWDYSHVRISFDDSTVYQRSVTDDSFFNLFNIGFSLRESCHGCPYTSTHRCGDMTLADFWGFLPKNFKMRDFQKGVSLILINSEKAEAYFTQIADRLIYEKADLSTAVRGNMCLEKPFLLPEEQQKCFWEDYNAGETVALLCKKYVVKPFRVPKHVHIQRLKHKYRWVIKR